MTVSSVFHFQLKSELEQNILEWERREFEMEKRLNEFEKDRDRSLNTAAKTLGIIINGSKDLNIGVNTHATDFPDTARPVSEQLEYVCQRLAAKQQLVVDLTSKLTSLQREHELLNNKFAEVQTDMRTKEGHLVDIKNQLATNLSQISHNAESKLVFNSII